ncbi:MAG: hypothetical protein ACOX12_02530 [Eggerthellaceae bacterium]|jgi:glutathione S-transferase
MRRNKPANTAKEELRSSSSPSDNARDLSKLDRLQLLQLLDAAVRENTRLKEELAEANKQLEDRRIALADSESLADAALRLSGIFEDAQRAIDIYRSNVAASANGAADAQPATDSASETQAVTDSNPNGSTASADSDTEDTE